MESMFRGKKLERITVAYVGMVGPPKFVRLTHDSQTYELPYIGHINNAYLFDLKCNVVLIKTRFKFIIDANKGKAYVSDGCMFFESDAGYNHVNEYCKMDIIVPASHQIPVSIVFCRHVAITILVSD
jgi:hypothetical protein